MRTIVMTSVLALGLGCGAAIAQTQQSGAESGASTNCTVGAVNCKAGSQTKQQIQRKAGAKTDEQAQGKAGAGTDQQAQGQAGMKTEEQAQGKAGMKPEKQARDKAKCPEGTTNCKAGTNEQAQGKTGATTDEQAQGKTGTDQSKTASINKITVEQKTEVTNVIRETHVAPAPNLDIDISVGVTIPQKKVRLHRLPHRIVEIVPAYQDYEYFVLADGRIVIVDPNSYEIVAILEV